MAKRQPEPAPAPPEYPKLARVAYKGILDEFKIYAAKDGQLYVRLPNGRRAFVTARRDGTFILSE